MKSLNHEPQESITRQTRLESAFNKILVMKGVNGLRRKHVMRLTMVQLAEKT